MSKVVKWLTFWSLLFNAMFFTALIVKVILGADATQHTPIVWLSALAITFCALVFDDNN